MSPKRIIGTLNLEVPGGKIFPKQSSATSCSIGSQVLPKNRNSHRLQVVCEMHAKFREFHTHEQDAI